SSFFPSLSLLASRLTLFPPSSSASFDEPEGPGMPLVKGLLLLAYFSIACGELTAVNAVLLQRVAGVTGGLLSGSAGLGIAFLQTLLLLELVDRAFLRPRPGTRPGESTPGPSHAEEKGKSGKGES